MNILIVTQFFYPEEFKINELTAGLVERGHQVTVITGKPNYPKGMIYNGYKLWGVQKDHYKGAEVIRLPILPRRKGKSLQLIANYISFIVSAGTYIATHRLHPDSIFVWESSPITQVYPALLLKRRIGCKVSMWVQDLWPESVDAASNIHNPLVMKALNSMVRSIYRRLDTIFVQSTAFEKSIIEKGPFKDKIVYAPNWADDLFLHQPPHPERVASLLPKGFIVMFAGNIGMAQDFDSIIEAASHTRQYQDIHWVFVGDGRYRADAERMVRERNLGETVHFIGRHPVDTMPDFYAHADAMLVSLRDEYIFSLTVPCKVQSIMAFGKPIVSMLNGIGRKTVEDAQCGLTAASGDAQALGCNVLRLYNMTASERAAIGAKGKDYYARHFSREKVIDTIVSHL